MPDPFRAQTIGRNNRPQTDSIGGLRMNQISYAPLGNIAGLNTIDPTGSIAQFIQAAQAQQNAQLESIRNLSRIATSQRGIGTSPTGVDLENRAVSNYLGTSDPQISGQVLNSILSLIGQAQAAREAEAQRVLQRELATQQLAAATQESASNRAFQQAEAEANIQRQLAYQRQLLPIQAQAFRSGAETQKELFPEQTNSLARFLGGSSGGGGGVSGYNSDFFTLPKPGTTFLEPTPFNYSLLGPQVAGGGWGSSLADIRERERGPARIGPEWNR